jgi:hypothetical protein
LSEGFPGMNTDFKTELKHFTLVTLVTLVALVLPLFFPSRYSLFPGSGDVILE